MTALERHLFLVSVGPAQRLITAAQRTNDLWAGSHLLAGSARAAVSVFEQDREAERDVILISPTTADEPAAGGELTAVVPNRLVVSLGQYSPQELRALSDRLENAVHDDWERHRKETEALVRELHAKALADLNDKPASAPSLAVSLALLAEQAREAVEVLCVWTPQRPDYGVAYRRLHALLHGRKLGRLFDAAGSDSRRRDKSSLDGRHESIVSGETLRPADQERWRIDKTEALDFVGLVKRRTMADKVSDPSGERATAVSRIALDPWLRTLSDTDLTALRTCYEPFRFNGSLGGQARWVRAGRYQDFAFEGQLLYRFRLDEERERVPERANRQAYLQALDNLEAELVRIGDRHGAPSPYYGIVTADGDNVGQAIGELPGPQAHQGFYKELSGFATRARELIRGEHQGHCVYSAADELLALVPLDQLLPIADGLRAAYHEAMGAYKTTLSVGIGIGHMLEPLNRSLARAHGALAHAKAAPDKDSVGLIVKPRNGGEVRVRWDPYDQPRWRQLPERIAQFADGTLPGRLPYLLRDLRHGLGTLLKDEQLRGRQLARLMGRRDTGLSEAATQALETLTRQLTPGTAQAASTVDSLIVARFLAQEVRT